MITFAAAEGDCEYNEKKITVAAQWNHGSDPTLLSLITRQRSPAPEVSRTGFAVRGPPYQCSIFAPSADLGNARQRKNDRILEERRDAGETPCGGLRCAQASVHAVLTCVPDNDAHVQAKPHIGTMATILIRQAQGDNGGGKKLRKHHRRNCEWSPLRWRSASALPTLGYRTHWNSLGKTPRCDAPRLSAKPRNPGLGLEANKLARLPTCGQVTGTDKPNLYHRIVKLRNPLPSPYLALGPVNIAFHSTQRHRYATSSNCYARVTKTWGIASACLPSFELVFPHLQTAAR